MQLPFLFLLPFPIHFLLILKLPFPILLIIINFLQWFHQHFISIDLVLWPVVLLADRVLVFFDAKNVDGVVGRHDLKDHASAHYWLKLTFIPRSLIINCQAQQMTSGESGLRWTQCGVEEVLQEFIVYFQIL